jgi:hypothetical protein
MFFSDINDDLCFSALLEDLCNHDAELEAINHSLEETLRCHFESFATKPIAKEPLQLHSYDDLYCQASACDRILRLTLDSYTNSKEKMKETTSNKRMSTITSIRSDNSQLNLFESVVLRLPSTRQENDTYCTIASLNDCLLRTDSFYNERNTLPNAAEAVSKQRKASSRPMSGDEDFESFMKGRELFYDFYISSPSLPAKRPSSLSISSAVLNASEVLGQTVHSNCPKPKASSTTTITTTTTIDEDFDSFLTGRVPLFFPARDKYEPICGMKRKAIDEDAGCYTRGRVDSYERSPPPQQPSFTPTVTHSGIDSDLLLNMWVTNECESMFSTPDFEFLDIFCDA